MTTYIIDQSRLSLCTKNAHGTRARVELFADAEVLRKTDMRWSFISQQAFNKGQHFLVLRNTTIIL